ncbi:hypothetical protein FSP39_022871 [Pinctada imbricata]|uniref:Uncharacterized protein n=1 Tax=Pinctada imbricata TaxID=66713 RepID=A0AA88Y3N0_PINIB|nr:hypothetical protein FSP39_022871 [Pinctada imbricata]
MKQLYDTTKKLAGRYRQAERPLKGKNANVLLEADKQPSRWAEHFEELLNRPAPDNPSDIHEAETYLPINLGRPNRGEIVEAIRHL